MAAAGVKLQLANVGRSSDLCSSLGTLEVVFTPSETASIVNPPLEAAVMEERIKHQTILPLSQLEATGMAIRDEVIVTLVNTNNEEEERHVAILNRHLGVCRVFVDISLNSPGYVTMTTDMRSILVSEEHRIIKISLEGVVEGVAGDSEPGDTPMSFYSPSGMAIHPTSHQLYIADHSNNRVQVLNTADLSYSFLFPATPPFVKDPCCPTDLSFDSKGTLYIADGTNHCIMKYTANGQYISMFSSFGSDPGLLTEPTLLAVSGMYVYVCEIDGDRVTVFDVNGYFQFVIKTHDRMCVTGFDVTPKGDLYLCDYSLKNIVAL